MEFPERNPQLFPAVAKNELFYPSDESAQSSSPVCVYAAITGAFDCQGGEGFQVLRRRRIQRRILAGSGVGMGVGNGVQLADKGTGLNGLNRYCVRGEETKEDVDGGSQK